MQLRNCEVAELHAFCAKEARYMKKLFSGIKWFEDTLTSAFLSIVVLITLANVVARYVMKSSIP